MKDRRSRIDWLIFAALGLMWGSSYLFIKLGVETLTPFTLVALRLAIGAALLAAVVAIAREPMPRAPRVYGHLAVVGFLLIALPFSLITFAELEVSSSLAAILTGTVPLFAIVIAALALRDEPITVNRVVGLVVGFAGVVLITTGGAGALSGSLPAQAALLLAAASYAAGGVYAKRFVHGLRPMVTALLQVVLALAMTGAAALLIERPFALEYTPLAVFSVAWLGLLGSGLAYLAFFRLLATWGATRTSLVAYLLPVVGIVLGAVVASEVVTLRMLGGTALVIGGIALVNARYGRRRLFGRAAAGAAAR